MIRDSTIEAIHRAVETAAGDGCTPDEFVKAARQSWAEVLSDAARYADADFDQMIRRGR